MRSRTNVSPPDKFKKEKGYSKINLHTRKKKDEKAIKAAGNTTHGKIVFMKSNTLDNPDKTSSQKKVRRGDAVVVGSNKFQGWPVMPTFKYKKNLAEKKKK